MGVGVWAYSQSVHAIMFRGTSKWECGGVHELRGFSLSLLSAHLFRGFPTRLRGRMHKLCVLSICNGGIGIPATGKAHLKAQHASASGGNGRAQKKTHTQGDKQTREAKAIPSR